MGRSKAVANCASKRRYDSEQKAIEAQSYLWDEKMVNVDIYKCWLCSGWHLTSAEGYDEIHFSVS